MADAAPPPAPHREWAELVEHLRTQRDVSTADIALARLATGSEDPQAWLAYWEQIALVSSTRRVAALAALLGWPMVTLTDFEPAATQAFSRDWIRAHRIVPWAQRDGHLVLALDAPAKATTARAMAALCARPVVLALTTPEHLEAALKPSASTPVTGNPADHGQAGRLEALLLQGLERRASDVHLEPHGTALRLRWRIDGRLQPGPQVPPVHCRELLNHLKLRAGLASTETRRPQDGRFSAVGRHWRVSILPALTGESVVMRLLDHTEAPTRLDALQMPSAIQYELEQELHCGEGLLLVTGPTGSGKTTTLYALVRALSGPTRKVVTVEDPIEAQLPGVGQVAVRPQHGLSFADALRALLRQSPDVILIGEIRDAETARVAVEASLTGHLVLSSLHTNDSVGAVTRLRDLGIENYRLAASLRGVLAQRLATRHTGQVGRRAIFEWLRLGPALAEAIHAGQHDAQLRVLAQTHGHHPLSTHARELIAKGEIAPETLDALGVE
ncbi:MAG: GspE/PulE family protein [Verrucomicrobiota bacterium JB022]|nr:GspE/PulE family protein [Verrucomicrobiota bacterium JB022]